MKKVDLSSDGRTLIVDYGRSVTPLNITLINYLPNGFGDLFIENGLKIQEKNPNYINEYNEPSTKLIDGYFDRLDPTVIYSFGVGKEDLVFHKHAGRRAINGITGGMGAIMKFSYCTTQDEGELEDEFIKNMVVVEIPPDTQFILKFDAQIYHQFCPRGKNQNAFFAVSVHPQEDQNLEGETLVKVRSQEASIPLLTIPVTEKLAKVLREKEGLGEIQRIILKSFE